MSVGQIHLYVRDRDFGALGRGSHALKQVLERLAWFADEDGMSVFPKMQTIADALGITKRGVRFRMRALEEKGFVALVEEARQHRPRVYRIDVDKILGLPLTETGRNRLARETLAAPKDPAEPGGKSTSSGESRGEKSDTQGGNLGHPGGKSTSPPIEEDSYQDSEEQESPLTRARGTRLAGDWEAGPADFAYGRGRGFSDQEIRDHASNFKTHFTAGNGRTRTHLRWSGDGHSAFAVWLRKERPGNDPPGAHAPGRGGAGRDRRSDQGVVAAVNRVTD